MSDAIDDKELIAAATQVLAAARVYADTSREIEAKIQARAPAREVGDMAGEHVGLVFRDAGDELFAKIKAAVSAGRTVVIRPAGQDKNAPPAQTAVPPEPEKPFPKNIVVKEGSEGKIVRGRP